jgi:hypothetical protein
MGAAEAFISGIRELNDFTALQSAVEPIVIDVDEYSPIYRVLVERTQVDTLWVDIEDADDEDDALEKAYIRAHHEKYECECWDSDSTEYETKEVQEVTDE